MKKQSYSKAYLFGISVAVLSLDTAAGFLKNLGDIIMQAAGFFSNEQAEAFAEAVSSGKLDAGANKKKGNSKKQPVGFHV